MYRQFAESDGQARIFLMGGSRYGLVFGAYAIGLGLLFAGILWWPYWVLLIPGAAAGVLFRLLKVLCGGLRTQFPSAIAVGCALGAVRLPRAFCVFRPAPTRARRALAS